jgi:DedD protein
VNDILKQRLVGALILVALGVVFWPIIFVQPEEKIAMDQQSMPPSPAISTVPIEPPDQMGLRASPEIDAQSNAAEMAATVDANQAVSANPDSEAAPQPLEETPIVSSSAPDTRNEAPEKLKVDDDGVPIAWTLQVATVSSSEKAEQLRQRLLKMNEKAYVVTLNRGGKRLYRVSVGPKFERAELDKLRANIDAEFGVTSMVARYVP